MMKSKAVIKRVSVRPRAAAVVPAAAKKAAARSGATPGKKKAAPKVDVRPERVSAILDGLRAAYPNAECALTHSSPWELVVATILSAQCTDVRVNLVTPKLFRTFPTPQAFAEASLTAIEEDIRTTGFFHNKAKSISGAAKLLLSQYGGVVPQTMDELLVLPGVARKTANVVLGVAFKKAEGIVVDTHVLRLSQRLQLTVATDPKKIEQDLVKILPRGRWIDFSHELILHGRQVCIARKPKCVDCTIEAICNSSDKTWSSHPEVSGAKLKSVRAGRS